MRFIYLTLLCTLFGCIKENNCTVTKIYSGNEEIKEVSIVDGVAITIIDKEYIVLLECY